MIPGHSTAKAAAKPERAHFVLLDGMRGVAAICVLMAHIGHWTDRLWLTPHGSLAVDFFFCLSGYVLAHAYGEKIAHGLRLSQFMAVRLARLYPMIALALSVSAVYVFARGLVDTSKMDLPALIWATLTGLFVLPYFNAPAEIGGPAAFPLNGPQWSLFYELVANAVWLAAFAFLTRRRMIAVILVSVLAALFYRGGDLGSNFLAGLPRVAASFTLGLLLYDMARAAPIRLPSFPPLLFLAALFVLLNAPALPDGPDRLLDAAAILVVFPFLVMAGAGQRIGGWLKRICIVLGELSYPLYAIHYAIFCWTNGLLQYLKIRLPDTVEIAVLTLVPILMSWVILKVYDEPVRRLLTQAIFQRARHHSPSASRAP